MYRMLMEISKRANFSNVKAIFGFKNETNIGMIFFPAIQAYPCFFEKKICLIPAAIDQDPYWRLTRDIQPKLGYPKTAAIHSKFVPSLLGPESKMSASIKETAIYLNDDTKTVREKVMKYAFSGGQPTIEEHRKHGGNPDVDVAYQWLSIFFEPDAQKLKQIHDDYRSGKMLTGEIKQILTDKVNKFLEDHHKKKEKAAGLADKMKYSGKLAKRMWE
jgi:tryptophanyl-tRNA synthetase